MKRIMILLIPIILALTSPGIANDIDLMFPKAAKSGEEQTLAIARSIISVDLTDS